MKRVAIYIPGLGDRRTRGQERALALWRLQGVEAEIFAVRWYDKEAFEDKLRRLLARIDELDSQGKQVSLVAASAGASMAVNAYAARPDKVQYVVSICGKLQAIGIGSVHGRVYSDNPAFHESMQRLAASEASLDHTHRRRILSMYPIFDESVPVRETQLQDARLLRMPVSGHFLGIAYGLTAGSRKAVRFLKRGTV